MQPFFKKRVLVERKKFLKLKLKKSSFYLKFKYLLFNVNK